jgi:hypothetical protein
VSEKFDPVTARYLEEVGIDALMRQRYDARSGMCLHCWARPGEPHNLLCPNRDADEEDEQPTQEEALF